MSNPWRLLFLVLIENLPPFYQYLADLIYFIKFFLNHHQNKFGISTNYFFCFISFIILTILLRYSEDENEADVELKKLKETKESDEIEDLPTIIKEGKDFRNDLPDRLYLDSHAEYHLNFHIIFSYLLLYHIDSHVLMVLRRIIVIYVIYMITGLGIFTFSVYYPVLLEGPIWNLQHGLFWKPLYHR